MERLAKLMARAGYEEWPDPRSPGSLIRRAVEKGYRGDVEGGRTLIAWRLCDLSWHWTVRMRTEWAIRDAVTALAERHAEPEALVREAARINDKAECPFFPARSWRSSTRRCAGSSGFGGRRMPDDVFAAYERLRGARPEDERDVRMEILRRTQATAAASRWRPWTPGGWAGAWT